MKSVDATIDFKIYNDRPDSHVVLKDAFNFFKSNVTKSISIFIGCEDWKEDLSLLESYSFPTIVCDPLNHQSEWRSALEAKRGKLMDWLNYLKTNECDQYFVNPKWIAASNVFPGHVAGSRQILNDVVDVVPWETLIQQANDLRGIYKPQDPYFALCKIAVPNHEIEILSNLLASPLRPSLLYVRWSVNPDESQLHTESAGHLQCAGYRLITIYNSHFIYQYTGQDIYSCCSWIKPSMNNPLIQLMTEQTQDFVKSIVQPSAELKFSTVLPK